MDEITILQAEVLKTLASPRRLEILHQLERGPMEVGRLASAIGASQPNVSQHLAVLRASGVVEAVRDGREVRYGLADPDVMVACGLMRAVLQRRLNRLAGIAMSPVPAAQRANEAIARGALAQTPRAASGKAAPQKALPLTPVETRIPANTAPR